MSQTLTDSEPPPAMDAAPPIITVERVTKRFGRVVALDEVCLEIREGEFFALLGPSGCGKSTLLRIIAGLETPSEGRVLIGGEDMTTVPANRRPVNMVFQSYAVFPHMSVAENVAYGLRLERRPKAEIRERVERALAQVHLEGLGGRMPDQLSGGQRQRVALARALVKRPKVLLLDEPLSALDAKLRNAMRLELVKLQQEVGVTFIIVTHDQAEAMAVADRIAVLEAGRLRQVASPAELYQRPVDAFVADFIGTVNFFEPVRAEARGGAAVLEVPELGLVALPGTALPGPAEAVVLALRPEKIALHLDPPASGEGRLAVEARLGDVAFQGDSSVVEMTLAGGRALTATLREAEAAPFLDLDPGTRVWASWRIGDLMLLPRNALDRGR